MISALIFGFLSWTSRWWLQHHMGMCRLVWPLLRTGIDILDHFFCKMYFDNKEWRWTEFSNLARFKLLMCFSAPPLIDLHTRWCYCCICFCFLLRLLFTFTLSDVTPFQAVSLGKRLSHFSHRKFQPSILNNFLIVFVFILCSVFHHLSCSEI